MPGQETTNEKTVLRNREQTRIDSEENARVVTFTQNASGPGSAPHVRPASPVSANVLKLALQVFYHIGTLDP